MSSSPETQVRPLLPARRLESAFQPVYSLSHGRLVGHEALLRVFEDDGTAVPPNLLFDSLANLEERAELDERSLRLHLASYVAAGKADAVEWLLLNVHPATLLQGAEGLARIEKAIRDSEIPPSRLVIEVLESPLSEDERLLEALTGLRAMGCLIALDDFGAGHSNFERVFELAPHLVKLDRRVLLRAKADARARRILQRMVSLLHEAGSLVLLEGIETLEGGHIALTADADFVQGYFYGRPQRDTVAHSESCAALEQTWATFDIHQSRHDDRWRERMAEHCDQLRLASIELAAGAKLEDACRSFLELPHASMCYLLDQQGRQLHEVAFKDGANRLALSHSEQFAPLHDTRGARWSRRQYFRRAVTFTGAVQITRPYLTLQGGRMCFTASVAFEIEDQLVILCGDLVVGEVGSTA